LADNYYPDYLLITAKGKTKGGGLGRNWNSIGRNRRSAYR
jgi:hypothetical protein